MADPPRGIVYWVDHLMGNGEPVLPWVVEYLRPLWCVEMLIRSGDPDDPLAYLETLETDPFHDALRQAMELYDEPRGR